MKATGSDGQSIKVRQITLDSVRQMGSKRNKQSSGGGGEEGEEMIRSPRFSSAHERVSKVTIDSRRCAH
ncbi:hypothetical protein Bca4012_003529 [Brassica carinata]